MLSHETALDLYELCDVNPSAIHLTVPSGFRTRKTVPEIYRLHQFDLDPGEVGSHEGIPIVTPERAIVGGIEQALGWQLSTRRSQPRVRVGSSPSWPRSGWPRCGIDRRQSAVADVVKRLPGDVSHLQRLIGSHAVSEACRRRGCSGG